VDLAGHTSRARLQIFAQRPAPISATYLGYPFTTGLRTIDYRLTDAIADPIGEPNFYTEELLRLPGSFCTFARPENSPDVGPLPAAVNGHVTFGSLHILLRLNRTVLETWCELLRAVPTARLLIFRDQMRGTVRDNIFRFITSQGIAAHRIDLECEVRNSGGYLDVYNGVDISLDTFPWSGHTTSCQALWMGVPVITLRGERHAGRMVASVLHQVGLATLIAESRAQYVQIAARLAGDIESLAKLRSRLRDQVAASLCDGAGFTRNLEAAYRRMWERRKIKG
jgi:protein O-GlcNAc transferase